LAATTTALLPSEAFAANNPPTSGSVRGFKTLRSYPLAPNVAFQDQNGRNRFTNEFRNQPILITFWSVNCHACLVEMPTLDRVYQKAERAGIKVLPISIDQNRPASRVQSYYSRKGHRNLPIYTDEERLMFSFYNGYATPMSFIVDRRGHVAGGIAGLAGWDSPEAWNLLSYYL
ncbi:MAG: TlpA disulfide reductase family protein, partial [Alphaproteobacteria bacterium]